MIRMEFFYEITRGCDTVLWGTLFFDLIIELRNQLIVRILKNFSWVVPRHFSLTRMDLDRLRIFIEITIFAVDDDLFSERNFDILAFKVLQNWASPLIIVYIHLISFVKEIFIAIINGILFIRDMLLERLRA